MTPTPAVSAKEKARERVLAYADLLARYRNEQIDEQEAIDQIAALSATEGEAEPVAWRIDIPNFGPALFSDEAEAKAQLTEPGCEQSTIRALVIASPPSAPAGVKETERLRAIVASVKKTSGDHVLIHEGERLSGPAVDLLFGVIEAIEDALSSLQPDTQAAAASAPAGDLGLASASVRPEPGEVETTLRAAVQAVTNATSSYLPPDGISKDELIDLVLAATDNPKINAVMLGGRNGTP